MLSHDLKSVALLTSAMLLLMPSLSERFRDFHAPRVWLPFREWRPTMHGLSTSHGLNNVISFKAPSSQPSTLRTFTTNASCSSFANHCRAFSSADIMKASPWYNTHVLATSKFMFVSVSMTTAAIFAAASRVLYMLLKWCPHHQPDSRSGGNSANTRPVCRAGDVVTQDAHLAFGEPSSSVTASLGLISARSPSPLLMSTHFVPISEQHCSTATSYKTARVYP